MSPGIELGTSRTEGRALTNCAILAVDSLVVAEQEKYMKNTII